MMATLNIRRVGALTLFYLTILAGASTTATSDLRLVDEGVDVNTRRSVGSMSGWCIGSDVMGPPGSSGAGARRVGGPSLPSDGFRW